MVTRKNTKSSWWKPSVPPSISTRRATVQVPILIFMAILMSCSDAFVYLDFLDGGADSFLDVSGPATIALDPSESLVTTRGMTVFQASGGLPPYSYKVISGPGGIDSTTGIYTSSAGGISVIRALDSVGGWGETMVEVLQTGNSGLWLSPAAAVVDDYETITYIAGGGVPPYDYTVYFGAGLIGSDSNVFTAQLNLSETGCALVMVTDSTGDQTFSTVVVRNPDELFSITPRMSLITYGDSVDFSAEDIAGDVNWVASFTNSSTVMNRGSSATYTPMSTGIGVISATSDSMGTTYAAVAIVSP